MKLSEVLLVVAEATDQPNEAVRWRARRLQEIGALPKSPGGQVAPELDFPQVALLLLSMLADGSGYLAARRAVELAGFTNDATRADRYIGRLLGAATFKVDAPRALAFFSSVTVTGGSCPAVVVRASCTDDPVETAFTADGEPYVPHEAETIVPAATMPGLLLHRIGRALNGLGAA